MELVNVPSIAYGAGLFNHVLPDGILTLNAKISDEGKARKVVPLCLNANVTPNFTPSVNYQI
jgi:hypothetical protein